MILQQKNIFSSSRKIFILLLLAAMLPFSIILGYFFNVERGGMKRHLEKIEHFAVSQQQAIAHSVMQSVQSDILFLGKDSTLLNYLDNSNQTTLKYLVDDYTEFSKSKGIYDQIRFIDNKGMELVRVNFNSGNPYAVHPKKLQNKKDRYYFAEAIGLGRSEIFISPLDLNVERKTVELPQKPMIRLCTPVFDRKGEKRGVVVVNYLAKHLLDKIAEMEGVTTGRSMLINREGYYLLHPDDEKEWGFMLDNESQRIGVDDNTFWDVMNNNEEGQIYTVNGLYTYQKISPVDSEKSSTISESGGQIEDKRGLIPGQDYLWFIVSTVTKSELRVYYRQLYAEFIAFSLFIMVVVGVAAHTVSLNIVKRRAFQKKLQNMALSDQLTGLANRSLFYDRLDLMVERGKRYMAKFAIIFIDLDGFKLVNDTYGHAVGDKLLIIVADKLRQHSRKTDTVARLGGDEFVILYSDMKSVDAVKSFVERIMKSFQEEITIEEKVIDISLSMGVSSYPDNGEEAIVVLNKADEAMYRAKQAGKNGYCIASV